MAMAIEASIEYTEENCHISVPLHFTRSSNDEIFRYIDYVKNLYNAEVFVDDYNFIIYIDNVLFTCRSNRRFDLEGVTELYMYYHSDTSLTLDIPLFPEMQLPSQKTKLNLQALRNITDLCMVNINNEMTKLNPNFGYGFANQYTGPPDIKDTALEALPILTEPHLCSPVSKKIKRESLELKKFSKEAYQQAFKDANMQDLRRSIISKQIDYQNNRLTDIEEHIKLRLNQVLSVLHLPSNKQLMSEIQNGLLSILFAICYDIRCNSGGSTADEYESAWNRCVLSATLCNFETFYSIKDCIVTFMRRCLIYPKIQSFDIGKQCLEDTFIALKYHREWVMKQLLVTHFLFATSNMKLLHLNRYFLRHYIRYAQFCSNASDNYIFNTLAHNLKNVYLDMQKSDLRLGLYNLDVGFLRELVAEINSLNVAEVANIGSDTVDEEQIVDEEEIDDELATDLDTSVSGNDEEEDFKSSCVLDECDIVLPTIEEFSSDEEDLEIF